MTCYPSVPLPLRFRFASVTLAFLQLLTWSKRVKHVIGSIRQDAVIPSFDRNEEVSGGHGYQEQRSKAREHAYFLPA